MKNLLCFCLSLLLFLAVAPAIDAGAADSSPSAIETIAVADAPTVEIFGFHLTDAAIFARSESPSFNFSTPVRARYYTDGEATITSKRYATIDPGNCITAKPAAHIKV